MDWPAYLINLNAIEQLFDKLRERFYGIILSTEVNQLLESCLLQRVGEITSGRSWLNLINCFTFCLQEEIIPLIEIPFYARIHVFAHSYDMSKQCIFHVLTNLYLLAVLPTRKLYNHKYILVNKIFTLLTIDI